MDVPRTSPRPHGSATCGPRRSHATRWCAFASSGRRRTGSRGRWPRSGDDAAIRHVATLADLPDDDAADAVDRLVAAGILAAGRTVRYMHPLTRAVVYDDLGQAGRSRLHKRAAAMLADEQAEPERVAVSPAADRARGRRAGRRPAAGGGGAGPASKARWRRSAPTCAARSPSRRPRSRCPRSCSSSAAPSRPPRSRGRPITCWRRLPSPPTPAYVARSPRPRRRSCCRPGARRRRSTSSTR